MSTLLGFVSIILPALIATLLSTVAWRSVHHRALFVVLACVVLYGLQALSMGPIMQYSFSAARSLGADGGANVAARGLFFAAIFAGIVGVPLLRWLMRALKRE